MPNGDKIKPKTTREHLLSIYGYITGLKNDVKHMHEGIHDLGGKIDKIYWVLLGTVGAVSLLLLEKVLDNVDFEVMGVDNAEVADWVYANCQTDQLILEYYTPGEPNSGWIHASYIPFQPRAQYMRAYREDKKTKYKPITGKAVDLV
jgi:hypothetical protein